MASISVDYSALNFSRRCDDSPQHELSGLELGQVQTSRVSSQQCLEATTIDSARGYRVTEDKPSSRQSRRIQGWRFGVAFSAAVAIIVLILNFVLALWASLTHPLHDGIGRLYVGDCDTVDTLSLSIHVLINGLSSILLGASNYTMQCLVSPTRSECDTAHARGEWLDIGIGGAHNLKRISWKRSIACLLLGLSSVPIHLLFNSTVFKTLDGTLHNMAVVNTAFFDKPDLSVDVEETVRKQGFPLTSRAASQSLDFVQDIQQTYSTDEAHFDLLSASDCVSTYGLQYMTGHSDVLLVAVDDGAQDNQTVFFTSFLSRAQSNSWICQDVDYGSWYCDLPKVQSNITNWTVAGRKVDHCLARRTDSYCQLQFSSPLSIAVVVCNLVKVLCMLWLLLLQHDVTLVTWGDAIASWLDQPDETTKGCCLMSKHEISERIKRLGGVSLNPPETARPYPCRNTSKTRWHHAVSWRRRVATYTLCTGALVAAGVLLHRAISGVVKGSMGPGGGRSKPITSLGFGTVEEDLVVDIGLPKNGSQGFAASVLLANLPQLILSLLYMSYNGLYTCMHLAHEYSQFAKHRKPLRVTTPRGKQKTTYWLQLPYKYSVPLIVASAVLHWLVSQSLFLVRISFWSDGEEMVGQSSSAVGYSCAPVVCVLVLGGCMTVVAIGLGFRNLDGRMPVAGSCSIALAAAAHRPEVDVDAAGLPVRWGEVPIGSASDPLVGHLCFTSEEVTEAQEGKLYAGYV